MFSIVEFQTDMSCEVCPNTWILPGNKCFWPVNINKEELEVFIRHMVNPGKDWGVYEIRILGAVATYGEALVKCKRAEEGSDLQSDPDNYGRGKRRRSFKRKLPQDQDKESDEENYDDNSSVNKILSALPPAPSPLLGHSSKYTGPKYQHERARNTSVTLPLQAPQAPEQNQSASGSSFSLPLQAPQAPEQNQSASSSSFSLPLQAPERNERALSSSQPLQASLYQPQSSSQPLQASFYQPQSSSQPPQASLYQPQSSSQPLQASLYQPQSPSQPQSSSQPLSELNLNQNQVLTPSAPKNDRLMKYVVRELNVLRHNQEKILDMLGLLLERNSNASSQQAAQEPPKLVQKFPVETMEEIYALEAAVGDSTCENELLTKWKSLGGNNLGDHTRRVLRHLCTDSVAEKFTWLGSRDKKCFSTLKISRLIVDAVLQTNGATRAQVEEIVKNWLRHAKERKDYKKKSAVAAEN